MAAHDPPSDDVLAALHYLEDRAHYGRSYPKTTGDAYRLQWFFIKRLLGWPVDWPFVHLEGGWAGGRPSGVLAVPGVDSIAASGFPALQGAVILAAGANITLSEAGQTITITGATPPTSALTLLYDNLLAADAASIDTGASAFAGTFKQLLIFGVFRSDEAVTFNGVRVRFNGDTGANYDRMGNVTTGGTNTPTSSFGDTGCLVWLNTGASAPANDFSDCWMQINDYGSSTKQKVYISDAGAMGGTTAATCQLNPFTGRWRSTAAINQVTVASLGGTVLKAGSRLTIYGAQ